MSPRLITLFLLVVFVPLAVLGGLGVKLVRDERSLVDQRLGELFADRLDQVSANIAQFLAERAAVVKSVEPLATLSSGELLSRSQASPYVRHYFTLNKQGELSYPDLRSSLTDSERAFLERTTRIWDQREINFSQPEGKVAPAAYGWHPWFWGNGLNLLLWWPSLEGTIDGAELNRARLLADIVTALPHDEVLTEGNPNLRIVLLDAQGQALYQWGAFEPPDNAPVQAERALDPPLGAWRLRYYAPPTPYGSGAHVSLAITLAAVALAIGGLAYYFYRENTRAMREATQRVNFVNQVSHELKTPLTNVRMYAEILDDELDPEQESSNRYLNIIVSESQRLSRLIDNILTFGRSQRNALKLHPTPGVVDDVVATVVDRTSEALRARGIAATFKRGASELSQFDHDVLEQIVGNLISNAEKYAKDADTLTITSKQVDGTISIRIDDNGPGVPVADREKIFEPFYRGSDKLTDGVTGTGIGLSIARDLARLHGGDLTCEAVDVGASFLLTMRTTGEPR
jgi:signal transduction histidine kinase